MTIEHERGMGTAQIHDLYTGVGGNILSILLFGKKQVLICKNFHPVPLKLYKVPSILKSDWREAGEVSVLPVTVTLAREHTKPIQLLLRVREFLIK